MDTDEALTQLELIGKLARSEQECSALRKELSESRASIQPLKDRICQLLGEMGALELELKIIAEVQSKTVQ